MEQTSALIATVAALAIGVVSPGPSFVMVARTAVAASRADGLAAALGMGAGGLVFALAALAGLHGVLLAVPSLYLVLKLAGGAWLVWLGIRLWRGARQPLSTPAPATEAAAASASRPSRRAFALGFATQVSNPKTAIVYASVVAAFLPPQPTWAFMLALAAAVFVIESGWYAVVALLLSATGPRGAYLRSKALLDRIAGGVMAALGLRLVASAGEGIGA